MKIQRCNILSSLSEDTNKMFHLTFSFISYIVSFVVYFHYCLSCWRLYTGVWSSVALHVHFSKSFIEIYLHGTSFTHLKCTHQCSVVYSQSRAAITTIKFRTVSLSPKETPCPPAIIPSPLHHSPRSHSWSNSRKSYSNLLAYLGHII